MLQCYPHTKCHCICRWITINSSIICYMQLTTCNSSCVSYVS